MKAKLFVVNETTLEEAKREKIAKIKIPLASKEKERGPMMSSVAFIATQVLIMFPVFCGFSG